METQCFERTSINGYEVININEYGFEYYLDECLERIGLVDDLEETIQLLLDDGWEEVR